jgi:hypothetical protein
MRVSSPIHSRSQSLRNMGTDIRIDGTGFNAGFVTSFKSEKELIDELSQEKYNHIFEGLTKTDKTKKIKLIYKIANDGK